MTVQTRPPERRRYRRLGIEATAKLYSPTEAWQTAVVDLSLAGVLLARPLGWTGKVGHNFRVSIVLDGGISIGMAVSVAHVDEQRIGFRLDKIDWDSFCTLRRALELNGGRPRQLRAELDILAESAESPRVTPKT